MCVGYFVWRKRITTLSDLLSTQLTQRIKYTYTYLFIKLDPINTQTFYLFISNTIVQRLHIVRSLS